MSEPSDSPFSIPRATISRLALYLRELQQLTRSGQPTVRSGMLGKRLGLNDSQVRRDLSTLGLTGRRGVGYEVRPLIQAIRTFLGTDRSWNVVLVGMGNLGQALAGYRGFADQGFQLVAAFDVSVEKSGTKVKGVAVYPLDRLESVLLKFDVTLAILAVPSTEAQSVVDRLVAAGVTGILNFAPVSIRSRRSAISIVDVDLAMELQRLACAVVRKTEESE